MRVAKIKNGYIQNVEVHKALPADAGGFTYMTVEAARDAGLERPPLTPEQQAQQDAHALWLTKRPRRTKVTEMMNAINNATTVAQLKAAMKKLARLTVRVMEYQKVDIDEDAGA